MTETSAEYDPEPVLSRYIERVPTAREAIFNDPLFKAHIEWLDRILRLAVPAMRHEGLDPRSIERVVNTIVYGAPEPDAAIERMTDFRVRVQQMQDTVIGKFNPGHEFTGLAELLDARWVHAEGDALTASDPEPPIGTLVRDDCGTLWQNDGHRPACWVQPAAEVHDPETWTKIAGNYGPVTVVKLGGAA